MSHLESDRLITHESGNREMQIEIFKASPRPLVMISPSMDRGVSLDGDLCRVVVIAKVPYASLGDPQIQRRMASANGEGQRWYAMKTIATIIQMAGRGVRSDTDWCTTYILDAQFKKLYGAHREAFPKWFREAIRIWNPEKRDLQG
jgi:Rad3-related DNA helicase